MIDTLGWLAVRITRAVHRAVAAAAGMPTAGQCRDPRSILVVQLDHIGDAVISMVLFQALRARYPRAAIEVLCGPWNRELFEACDHVDQVHVSRVNRFVRDHRGLWILAIFWWGWRMRRRCFDLGIDIRGEFPIAFLLWIAGVKRRLGWDCGGGGFLLTDSARYVPERPEVESRLALLAELGIKSAVPSTGLWPRFDPGPAARRRVAADLTRIGSTARPTFVLHVGAGMPAKRWPVELWCELIRGLCTVYAARVILVGEKNDSVISRRITAEVPLPDVIDLSGHYGLRDLAALLEQADMFVGVDSGPAHLAAAVGTPAVVLFSGTNSHAQWQPRGPQVLVVRHEVPCAPCHQTRCPLAGHPCMNGLPSDEVMQAVGELYDNPNRHSVARWLDASAGAGGKTSLSAAV